MIAFRPSGFSVQQLLEQTHCFLERPRLRVSPRQWLLELGSRTPRSSFDLTFDFVFQIDYFRTTYYKNGCWASQHSQLKANWVDLRSATQSLPPRLKQCKRRPKFSATASASKAETRSQQQQGEEVRREHSSQEFSVFEPLWATSRECVASLSCSQLCGQKLRRQRRYLMTERASDRALAHPWLSSSLCHKILDLETLRHKATSECRKYQFIWIQIDDSVNSFQFVTHPTIFVAQFLIWK